MKKSTFVCSAAAVAAGVALAQPAKPVEAQAVKVQPERRLLGVQLGRPFIEVLRRFGQPTDIQTVALMGSGEQLPGLGGAAGGMGDSGFGGMGGTMGGGPSVGDSSAGSMGAFGGGSPFGGGLPGAGSMGAPGMGSMGGPGGMMSPGGRGMGGFGGSMGAPGMGAPGMEGSMGMPGAAPGMDGGMGGPGGMMGGGAQNMPESSTAVLWIYKRPKNVRLEFLVNEDGKVAQISAAAPANVPYPTAATTRGVTLGTSYYRVLSAYGMPERTRLLAGGRFHEAYYSKKYHAAFTFDQLKGNKVVRVTIALAD